MSQLMKTMMDTRISTIPMMMERLALKTVLMHFYKQVALIQIMMEKQMMLPLVLKTATVLMLIQMETNYQIIWIWMRTMMVFLI